MSYAQILMAILDKHPELMDFAFKEIIRAKREEIDRLEKLWELMKEAGA